jgi:hypothetical protein
MLIADDDDEIQSLQNKRDRVRFGNDALARMFCLLLFFAQLLRLDKQKRKGKGDARRENAVRLSFASPSQAKANPKLFASAQLINGIFCQFGRVYSARTVEMVF